MDEENLVEQNEQEQKQESESKEIGDVLFGLKRKFDNFWYHYKIVMILGIIILAFLIFCVAQCALRVKSDADIAYIGTHEINSEDFDDLQSALSEILGEDFNGDGKIKVDFTQFVYMTSAQLDSARAGGQPIDVQSLVTVQTQIDLMLTEGNIILYFIDPAVYKELSQRPGVFMPLEDSLGYTPDDANDVYSIKLGSLPCWDYFSGLYSLPANTIITVRDMQLSEESDAKTAERYERNLLLFRRLVEFTFGSDQNDD